MTTKCACVTCGGRCGVHVRRDGDVCFACRLLRVHLGRESRAAQMLRIAAAVERIEHPCHDVCLGDLHADCQCAAFVRQEALAAIKGNA